MMPSRKNLFFLMLTKPWKRMPSRKLLFFLMLIKPWKMMPSRKVLFFLVLSKPWKRENKHSLSFSSLLKQENRFKASWGSLLHSLNNHKMTLSFIWCLFHTCHNYEKGFWALFFSFSYSINVKKNETMFLLLPISWFFEKWKWVLSAFSAIFRAH